MTATPSPTTGSTPTTPTPVGTHQTALTQLLNAAIASANPDPLANPLGVYWGHPKGYASGERRAGEAEVVELFREPQQPLQVRGSLTGYGLLMRQQNDGFGADIWRRRSNVSVLPATLWHNDIAPAGQLFPWLDGSTYPVQTVFDPYTATHWQFLPTLVASFPVGEENRFFPDSRSLNLPGWNRGIFYPHDANASDFRAAPLFRDYERDGQGGWQPEGGDQARPRGWSLPNARARFGGRRGRHLRDPVFSPRQWSAGQFAQGNPYANPPDGRRTHANPRGLLGGGAGLHTNARLAYTDRDLRRNARFLARNGGPQRWPHYAGTYNWPRWPAFDSNRTFPGIKDPTRFEVDSYFSRHSHFDPELLQPSWRRWLGEINDGLAGADRSFAPWAERFVQQLDRIEGPTEESRPWGWQWYVDWGIGWLNNLPDMIRLQNQLWLQRSAWKPQRDPYGIGLQVSDPALQLQYHRTYWGWNEIPMDADVITGQPLAFTLTLPTGYSSMQELFSAAGAFGPRILDEVYDAINRQVDWYADPANAKGFQFGSNQFALARQLSADGGRSYRREFFAEPFSTDRYRFSVQPFTAEGDYASEGWMQVTPISPAPAAPLP